MAGLDCPGDAELLAWLQDPLDVERDQLLTAHFDACPACQNRLSQLEAAEELRRAATGDGLLKDLERQPPLDEFETEPQCASAALRAAEVSLRSVHANGSRQPDASDVEALTHRGHYEILGVLGQGGMGVVYKARNRKMNRLVAIKVLPPLKTQDRAAVARFEREMKAIARLTHPNIVMAYDADEVDGKHFLVMEHIDGLDLKSLVKTLGPLPVAKAVDCLVQAARGLHHAHQQGIIHRDVKPANLMLDQSAVVKVLDLGLAHIQTREAACADLTETGMVLGTVDYLAPEQAAGARDIDGRVDVYSLGCSLYYLLTGRALYDGDSIIQKVLAHRELPIPSLRDACPECPDGLQQVFRKMVAKRPDERYQTMAEVIDALEGSTLATAGALPKAAASSKNQTRWRWLHGKRRALTGAVAVGLAGVCAVLWPLLLNRPHTGKGNEGDRSGHLASGAAVGQEWKTITNSVGMQLVLIPKGAFKMGSTEAQRKDVLALIEEGEMPDWLKAEAPQHEVEISKAFWMGTHEVTQEQFKAVMGYNPSYFSRDGAGKEGQPYLHSSKPAGGKNKVPANTSDFPVENVSWGEAKEFCAKLSDLLQEKKQGREYRLPTEAEWEYSCRGGTSTVFHYGNALSSTQANISGKESFGAAARGPFLGRTCKVGSYKPNAFGLFDMHGNVWEWCEDWYAADYYENSNRVDPKGPATGNVRVFRGGSWGDDGILCRAAHRRNNDDGNRYSSGGFRVVSFPGDGAP